MISIPRTTLALGGGGATSHQPQHETRTRSSDRPTRPKRSGTSLKQSKPTCREVFRRSDKLLLQGVLGDTRAFQEQIVCKGELFRGDHGVGMYPALYSSVTGYTLYTIPHYSKRFTVRRETTVLVIVPNRSRECQRIMPKELRAHAKKSSANSPREDIANKKICGPDDAECCRWQCTCRTP